MSYLLGKLVWGNFMPFHSYFQNAEMKPWSHLREKQINDNAIIIESHNHRITESYNHTIIQSYNHNGVGWKGSAKSSCPNPSHCGQGDLPPDLAEALSLALSNCKDGAYTTSLGTHFQCLAIFTLTNNFLTSNLNLFPFSL